MLLGGAQVDLRQASYIISDVLQVENIYIYMYILKQTAPSLCGSLLYTPQKRS